MAPWVRVIVAGTLNTEGSELERLMVTSEGGPPFTFTRFPVKMVPPIGADEVTDTEVIKSGATKTPADRVDVPKVALIFPATWLGTGMVVIGKGTNPAPGSTMMEFGTLAAAFPLLSIIVPLAISGAESTISLEVV
jgi:hypothetical protein